MTSLASGSSKDDKVGFSGNGLGCRRPEHLPRFSIKGMINMHITHALFTHRHTSVSAAFNFEGNMVMILKMVHFEFSKKNLMWSPIRLLLITYKNVFISKSRSSPMNRWHGEMHSTSQSCLHICLWINSPTQHNSVGCRRGQEAGKIITAWYNTGRYLCL